MQSRSPIWRTRSIHASSARRKPRRPLPGYALIVFNCDERFAAEKRILSRMQELGCDGMVLVPVGGMEDYDKEMRNPYPPKVLLGRTVAGDELDTVTIDNFAAGRQATNYLLDLGHRHIGAITGRMSISTGRGRLEGMRAAMARAASPRNHGLSAQASFVRSSPTRRRSRCFRAGPTDCALCRERRDGARRDAGTRRPRIEMSG